jgi:tol-pal system protein YbgF
MKRLNKRIRANHRAFWGVVWAAGLLALAGCATQASVVDLEMTTDSLKLQQSQLEERMRAVEGSARKAAGTEQSDQTDLLIKVDQLTSDLQTLQGKLEESGYLNSELSQRLDDQTFKLKELNDRLDVVDRQVTNLETTIAKLSKGGPAAGPAESPQAEESPPAQGKSLVLPGRTPGEGKAAALSPSEAYGLAYNDYLKGNYDLALMGFTNFLTQYQTTSLAPNAQYWIGECYYGKKDFRKAIEAFQKVVSAYPDSSKVPGATLKMGYAYLEMADRQKGEESLKKVIEDFPLSNEAGLAKNRLAELK